jgi:hypothetical protein
VKIRVFLALLACVLPAVAQKSLQAGKPAHIGYLYPAGGRQGTTVTVKIGGENVYGATAALISGTGVTAQVIDSKDPEAGVEFKKRKNKKKNQAVIDEVVTLRVTVAPDVEPGNRDLCLVTTNSLSNKLTFQVGQLNEMKEVETNNTLKAAMTLPTLPFAVNGVILPGDVDAFKFSAVKGQQLVAEVAARALLPYIADGVPGWFQAIIVLYNSLGKPVAEASDFQFSQDPVLFYKVPEDGVYTLTIRDTLYRGREDFVYRVKLGELPFITGIFPLGAPRGAKPVRVALTGVNLPVSSLLVEAGPDSPALQHLVVTNRELVSNPILFSLSELPERTESSPATLETKAQKVVLPVVLNGCIRAVGEKHFTRFSGTKGQSICLDVHARRLGSPLDSAIAVMDSRGQVLAENDDIKDTGEGFITHQADSGLMMVLPETGNYVVMITDKQGRGGAEYAYRLRISAPLPDFDLRMTPAAVCLPAGGTVPLTVHVIRRDNFKGAITLSLDGSASGLSLDGAVIPEGMDKITLTVSASLKAAGKQSLHLVGRAETGGKTLVHLAVPAENLMQAFLYQHLLPFQEETVWVTRPVVPYSVTPKLAAGGLVLAPGQETAIPVTLTRRPGYEKPIRVDLVDPPKGISLRKTHFPAGQNKATVIVFADSKVPLGLSGNLILSATMFVDREATPEEIAWRQKQAAKNAEPGKPGAVTNVVTSLKVTRPVTVTLPALSFRVVAAPPAKPRGVEITPPGRR